MLLSCVDSNKSNKIEKWKVRNTSKYHLQGLIGRGGYGQIFFAMDSRGEELRGVAIKTELKIRKGKIAKRMILEQKVGGILFKKLVEFFFF